MKQNLLLHVYMATALAGHNISAVVPQSRAVLVIISVTKWLYGYNVTPRTKFGTTITKCVYFYEAP